MKNCLHCYRELAEGESDFHADCSSKFFGIGTPPELPYTEEQMLDLGLEVIKSQIAVTGVQPKISLELEIPPKEKLGKPDIRPKRFTIVGLWGDYILKPPTPEYPGLPEIEDLTMKLAEQAGIPTVPHSLIRLKSGNLAYITKRIDRVGKKKIQMEDMCQLTDRLTEHKYRGSYEQVARIIAEFSAIPGLDLINFSEQVVFSFLTANADMHLKNFSIINQPGIGYKLSPAYDMVATALLVKGDPDELALNLNGKRAKLKEEDFHVFFQRLKIETRAVANILDKFIKVLPAWEEVIKTSFIPPNLKEEYIRLINARSLRIQGKDGFK